jgi:hypothetical protein
MADPTEVDVQVLASIYASIDPGDLDITFEACDNVNGNVYVADGNGEEFLLFYNSDGVNPQTVTITSVADEFGRTMDVTAYSIASTKYSMFGPIRRPGWVNSADSKVAFLASDAAVLVAVVRAARGAWSVR